MSAEKTSETRERILAAAAELLADGGASALSTRAVSAAADVQAPTLYRLFGDKDGLLDAVAAYGFERYLADKRSLPPTGDPVADLRLGWDTHLDFGLRHPSFYVLMYGTVRPGHRPAAARDAFALLRGMVERVARAGRLRVPVDAAAQTIQATSSGVVLSLISTPEADRDDGLSARVRETVLAALTTDPPAAGSDSSASGHAIALGASLRSDPSSSLTTAEAALLHQWLDRLAAGE